MTLERLKIKSKIAHLQIIKGKIKMASTSQDMSGADGPHYKLTSLKRKGYPVQEGMLKLASQDSKFAKYYLIDSQDTNGNGWGVTEASIKENIKSFIDMPFVVTAKEWIPDSPYETQYDHPFIPSNDLRSIFAHQEKFRVGTIVKVAKEDDNGKWYAMIKINPKYAHLSLPPFCSPAIYQIDPHESEGQMTKWIGLHLAGLMSDPAYGPRVAILRGSCSGNGTTCSHQFKMAKDSSSNAIKPFPQQDQSGLDITETDKIDSPLAEKEEESIKNAQCACPVQIAELQKRLLPHMTLKQKISKLKQARAKIATQSKIESVNTIPPIPTVQKLEDTKTIKEREEKPKVEDVRPVELAKEDFEEMEKLVNENKVKEATELTTKVKKAMLEALEND